MTLNDIQQCIKVDILIQLFKLSWAVCFHLNMYSLHTLWHLFWSWWSAVLLWHCILLGKRKKNPYYFAQECELYRTNSRGPGWEKTGYLQKWGHWETKTKGLALGQTSNFGLSVAWKEFCWWLVWWRWIKGESCQNVLISHFLASVILMLDKEPPYFMHKNRQTEKKQPLESFAHKFKDLLETQEIIWVFGFFGFFNFPL